MAVPQDEEPAPWSHRIPAWARLLVCAAAGAAVAFVGTLVHRAGASANVPYGLLLALTVVGMSAWAARARSGAVGLAVHLIVSSVVSALFLFGVTGDILAPIGFGGKVPFFSQNAGYFWTFGAIIVQVAVLMVPRRFVSGGAVERGKDGMITV